MYKEIKIQEEYIKLDQLLKMADLVQSGGHAKLMIQDGMVKLNGIKEYQRGKKIRVGDVVEIQGNKVKVIE
ncbi:ribosome-associated protein [Anaerosolibacter carboniphilus]|uniref:Ribosome-associated protein n=1 Tax=Anaerosolibacter carboniphilus TaxID=1417629 RepID=A0A841L4L1_9FIRM|nr:S4 domain-containing protein YaaA [Anaerosolibacter carboniphilus]MBB6218052.1 ribosome-associated protein [Anaerosolibacter carboniphilus]